MAKTMPKKFALGLLFLLLLTAAKPTRVSAQAKVFFKPESAEKLPGQNFPLELLIQSSEIVVGTDLVLEYDPTTVEVIQIKPGDFFDNPQVLAKTVDSQNGQITYSLFSFPGRIGSGSLLKLTARLLKTDFPQTTLSLKKETILAGTKGKRVQVSLGKASFSPGQSAIEPISDSDSAETSPRPASQEPTIFLIEEPTPLPTGVGENQNILLKVVALVLVGGGLAGLVLLKGKS